MHSRSRSLPCSRPDRSRASATKAPIYLACSGAGGGIYGLSVGAMATGKSTLASAIGISSRRMAVPRSLSDSRISVLLRSSRAFSAPVGSSHARHSAYFGMRVSSVSTMTITSSTSPSPALASKSAMLLLSPIVLNKKLENFSRSLRYGILGGSTLTASSCWEQRAESTGSASGTTSRPTSLVCTFVHSCRVARKKSPMAALCAKAGAGERFF
mmetsp:Transcript_26954/g.63162  ORF Transcript_26954/g.63162 Transcript_26954/m.63162 type:complete len:213 (+) Transcript_26954:99-737(+)